MAVGSRTRRPRAEVGRTRAGGIVAVVELDECWVCHRTIAGESGAVGRAAERVRYVPFVEDLRTSALELAHPVCFAGEAGVEAFVDVVHAHDREVAGRAVGGGPVAG
jgi:hypothetical protein